MAKSVTRVSAERLSVSLTPGDKSRISDIADRDSNSESQVIRELIELGLRVRRFIDAGGYVVGILPDSPGQYLVAANLPDFRLPETDNSKK